MSPTPSLYMLIARSRGVPLGTGRGSLSTAGAAGLRRSTAATSRTPIHSRFWHMRMSSSLTPTLDALPLCQHLSHLDQLRSGAIGLSTERGELLEIPPRPRPVTGAFGCQASAVQAAEAVWFLGDGSLVLRQGFGGPAKLHQ